MSDKGVVPHSQDPSQQMQDLQRRMLPQNVPAEEAVLGGILIYNEALNQVLSLIKDRDFYLDKHQWIFETMLELEKESEPVDVLSVANRLGIKDKERLDKIGGVAYLATLADRIPTAANITYYAKIIREKSIVRQLIKVGTEIVTEAYDDVEDVFMFLDQAEKRIFDIREDGATRDLTHAKEIVANTFKTIEQLFDRKELVTGVPTGFDDFDRMTSGLHPSDLVILAARPSMGKTALVLNIATNAAVFHKHPVAIFSLEMSKEQLMTRMLCLLGRVSGQRMRTGQMKDDDIPRLFETAQQLSNSPIYIDDSGDLGPLEMRAKCRRLKMEAGGLDMVIIDYLQLMRGDTPSASREREISEISRGLKMLAKELSCPVVALSQLNRSLERRPDKRPVMSDLRECVTGDTLVLLADGRRVPIETLVGQAPEVMSMTPEGKLVQAHADKVWHVGKKEVFEVRFASGRTIKATAKHRLYGPDGWCRVGSLQVGQRLGMACTPQRRGLSWDTVQSIVPLGEDEVYDLTVPATSAWIADSIISHNSGAIEQDADVIMFVYRDEVYNEDTEEKGIAEIIIGKQRNGPIGTVRLRFFHEFTRFDNLYPGDL